MNPFLKLRDTYSTSHWMTVMKMGHQTIHTCDIYLLGTYYEEQ